LLLVEDDELVRRRFARAFSRLGFEVDEAFNVTSAVAAAKAKTYDALVTDLELGRWELGFMVIDDIAKLKPLLAKRAVIVTGHPFTDAQLARHAEEGYFILPKSTAFDDLAGVLRLRIVQHPSPTSANRP